MSARLIDGKALSATIRGELAKQVADFTARTGVKPGLATVLVGENHPGATYVRNKSKACEEVGIASFRHDLPSATEEELLALIHRLNTAPQVHGILVQLPLPRGIREQVIVDAVLPLKDVDGFGPENLGLLAAGRPRFVACTPLGILQMCQRCDVPLAGKHVVIVGRSNIVGKPLALLLSQKGIDATVTICHSRTPDVGALTRQADVVVMAIGQAGYLKADMVRPGAVVIDVGTNKVPGSSKLVGDVDFAGVREVASAITPVPGGVGPMTITMLLHNTLQAARLQQQDHGEPATEI